MDVTAGRRGLVGVMIFAAVLGVLAAFLFALSAFLQQRASRQTVGGRLVSLRRSSDVRHLATRLPRSRTWRRGWLTNLGGWISQATALQVGSVAAVQPLMSSQLLFALSLSSAEQRRWPRARDWLSVAAVCTGLVLFLSTAVATVPTGAPQRPKVLLAGVASVSLTALLILLSRWSALWLASLLVGVGAGLCHAMSAVFIKMTTEDLLHRGVGGTALDWPGYALALTTLGGLLLGQLAFASGALPAAVAAISVTNPFAGAAVGFLAFDTALPVQPATLAAIAVSGLVIALGITGLANSPSTRWIYEAPAAEPGASRPVDAEYGGFLRSVEPQLDHRAVVLEDARRCHGTQFFNELVERPVRRSGQPGGHVLEVDQ